MWSILGFVLYSLFMLAVGSYYRPKLTRESGYFYFSYNKEGINKKQKLF